MIHVIATIEIEIIEQVMMGATEVHTKEPIEVSLVMKRMTESPSD